MQEYAEFFSKIREYSWFFRLFRDFSLKTFLYSELQWRDTYHKILQEIPRRKNIVNLLCDVVQKKFYTKKCPNGILRGLK